MLMKNRYGMINDGVDQPTEDSHTLDGLKKLDQISRYSERSTSRPTESIPQGAMAVAKSSVIINPLDRDKSHIIAESARFSRVDFQNPISSHDIQSEKTRHSIHDTAFINFDRPRAVTLSSPYAASTKSVAFDSSVESSVPRFDRKQYQEKFKIDTNNMSFPKGKNSSKSQNVSRLRRGSLHSKNLEEWAKHLSNKQISSVRETNRPAEDADDRLSGDIFPNINDSIESKSAIASDVMKRSTDLDILNSRFVERCLEELYRSFVHVHLTSGTLHIIPIEATNLPLVKRRVAVKIVYGDQVQKSFYLPSAATLKWYQEYKVEVPYYEGHSGAKNNFHDNGRASRRIGDSLSPDATNDARKEFQRQMNDSLKKSFAIDTLNIRGSIQVRIITEDFPKSKTVSQVAIPVLSLLDCLCPTSDTSNEVDYVRWFPLQSMVEYLPGEGEFGNLNKFSSSETRDTSNRKPHILLRMNWVRDKTKEVVQDPGIRVVAPSSPHGIA